MAKHSFIGHKGSFLQIHEDYLRITGNDFCQAAILDVLEYWTGIEWAMIQKSDAFRLPWIEVAIPKLHTEMYGMYSLRSIPECLREIEKAGFVSVQRGHGGAVNKYLLNPLSLTWAIDPDGPRPPAESNGWNALFSPKANGNFAVREISATEADGRPDGKSDGNFGSHLKESEPEPYPEEKITTPTPPSEDEPPAVRQKIVLSRLKSAGMKLDWQRGEKKQVIAWIEERSETLDQILFAIDGYSASPYWKSQGYPWPGFRNHFPEFLPDATRPQPREAQRVSAPSEATIPQGLDSDALQRVSAKFDYPAKWNELVPSKPVDWDPVRGRAGALTECSKDSKFVENFERICQLAQQIHSVRGSEVGWMSFQYAIKRDKDGIYGWVKILDEYAWMASPTEKSRPRQTQAEKNGDMITKYQDRLRKKIEEDAANVAQV